MKEFIRCSAFCILNPFRFCPQRPLCLWPSHIRLLLRTSPYKEHIRACMALHGAAGSLMTPTIDGPVMYT